MTSRAWRRSPPLVVGALCAAAALACLRQARHLRALGQGAALHFLDRTNGVKDFDVWTFYAADDAGPFPYRWTTIGDFGESRHGRWQQDPHVASIRGRRVDLIGRSLAERVGAEPVAALTRYLSDARTESARRLAEKAAVLLDPAAQRGTVVWPP